MLILSHLRNRSWCEHYIRCYFTIGIALWKPAGRNTDILQLINYCHILELLIIRGHTFFKKVLPLLQRFAVFAPIIWFLLIGKRFWCSHCLMSTVHLQIKFLPDRFTWLIRSETRVNKCCVQSYIQQSMHYLLKCHAHFFSLVFREEWT